MPDKSDNANNAQARGSVEGPARSYLSQAAPVRNSVFGVAHMTFLKNSHHLHDRQPTERSTSSTGTASQRITSLQTAQRQLLDLRQPDWIITVTTTRGHEEAAADALFPVSVTFHRRGGRALLNRHKHLQKHPHFYEPFGQDLEPADIGFLARGIRVDIEPCPDKTRIRYIILFNRIWIWSSYPGL
ncbi:hypothetical protein VOLCADRAFT_90073 [Volvox carteri f. nagariensis]|uniref:Uncharacterized protein n=1 Tax=Volvox carteri f. nagariensis TaxID=3068 RepID=D8TTE9_VOLCA|nr:uncharacterized protein VOLCADRAFT_90073 [Volvox carteri f. nagariensis]EFJ49293.1 hypothetical protein VOLCADRAFT_90073 [Volvox carteri f. nagariensis]|eukprot:XP_002949741.1 hypothetical protein VOLCADRAFT_90073 [Volvox carteri f. nagariensis]